MSGLRGNAVDVRAAGAPACRTRSSGPRGHADAMKIDTAPTLLAPQPSRPVSGSEARSGTTEANRAGQVAALVAVTGIKDDVNDVIASGGFRRTLSQCPVKGALGHN